MERAEFGSKLKTHDWYFAYSDDHRVWTRGRNASAALSKTHNELNCPYTMTELRTWAHNMVVEDFAEEVPGSDEWYRQPRKYKCVAPVKRADLMPRAFHDEITNWMTLGATVEQIAKIA
tara:strand:+ start:412 stop:768 length:357 start_codon:yes stop_codon:yes gene_type:complete